MKDTSAIYYPEDESRIKDIGRYSAATVEYSSLVLLSVLERGGRSITGGIDAVSSPCKKVAKNIDRVMSPLKCLGKSVRTLAIPFTWTAKQVAEAGSRGVPVHLDQKSIGTLQDSMQRIEQRLANIERMGLSVGDDDQHPTAADFQDKPTKEKSMLLRAVLEDSKHTLED